MSLLRSSSHQSSSSSGSDIEDNASKAKLNDTYDENESCGFQCCGASNRCVKNR